MARRKGEPAIAPREQVEALEDLAYPLGLSVRVARRDPERLVEVAWGECACALHTRGEGRQRAVKLVEVSAAQGLELLLLLSVDELPIDSSGRPLEVPGATFRELGLAALPEGRLASVS